MYNDQYLYGGRLKGSRDKGSFLVTHISNKNLKRHKETKDKRKKSFDFDKDASGNHLFIYPVSRPVFVSKGSRKPKIQNIFFT